MTLDTNEFIRRFLIHVTPEGEFHRIPPLAPCSPAAIRAANIGAGAP